LNFFGKNNELKTNLHYKIDVISQSLSRLVLTEGNDTRYSIPDSMLSNRSNDESLRLEMMGLKMFDSTKQSFGFKMVDVKNPNNVLLNTIG